MAKVYATIDVKNLEEVKVFISNYQEENARLREALTFYANENNHDNSKQHCEYCCESPIDFDYGHIAKSALEETK